MEHIINNDGSHYIKTQHIESSIVGYRQVAKLKVNGVWYIGFTGYYCVKECLLNTRDNMDMIMEII